MCSSIPRRRSSTRSALPLLARLLRLEEKEAKVKQMITDSDLAFECIGVISISDPNPPLGLLSLSKSVYLSVLLFSHLNLYLGFLPLASLISCFFPFQNVFNHKSLRSFILVVISGFLLSWTPCYRELYPFSQPTSYLWLLFRVIFVFS